MPGAAEDRSLRIRVEESTEVVPVGVGEDDGGDLLGLHADGGEPLAEFAVGRAVERTAAGVDEDELGAHAHEEDVEGDREPVGRQERGGERGGELRAVGLRPRRLVERSAETAVGEGDGVEGADLEAAVTGLLAGEIGEGAGARCWGGFCGGRVCGEGGQEGGGAGEPEVAQGVAAGEGGGVRVHRGWDRRRFGGTGGFATAPASTAPPVARRGYGWPAASCHLQCHGS